MTAPVTLTQLKNASADCNHIADIATTTALTVTDRTGTVKRSMAGAIRSIGWAVPVAYTSGLIMTLANQTVSYDGELYAPDPNYLPFTTSGTFETTKFIPLPEGMLRYELEATTGTDVVRYGIRSLTSRLNDWRSVFDWGTTTEAIQQAITDSVATKYNLHFPKYTYEISSNLTVPATGNFHISGDGNGTIFAATSAVTKIFDLASGITNFSMSNLVLSGDGSAPVSSFNTTYGIYAPGMSHCHLSAVVVELCSVGIYARSGWCNYFEDVKLWYNGIGLDAADSINQNTYNHCKFWLNLYGAVIKGGFANALYNCLFESNAKAGLVHNATSTLLSACYFEANGVVDVDQHPVGTVAGVVFTSPSQTVYADIIQHGGGTEWKSGTMSIYSPSSCLTIENCFTAPSVDEAGGGAFIYAIASKDLRVSGCSLNGYVVPLIKTYASATYSKNRNITEFNNEGFSSILKLDNQADGQRSLYYKAFKDSDTASRRNFAETDFLKWATLGAGAGEFSRKNIAGPNGVYVPVWAFIEASTSATIVKGFSITAENYPDNVGKLFMFSLQVKATSASVQITFRSKASAEAFSAGSTEWQTIQGTFIWPVSGIFSCSLIKSGNAGDLYVANPVLCEVGCNIENSQALFKNETVFRSSAAPTTGEWVRGDLVYDSTPASGAPIGWGCSVAGTPGTWIAMGNYA